MLMNVLLISGLAHILAIVVLGGITIVKYIIPDEAQFEEPPAIEEVEPPKEVKVEIKQQNAPQQQPLNNLRMKQVGNITVAAVSDDIPSMEESFTVSGALGGFSGGGLFGSTRGNIGIGVSDIDVLGIKGRAERVLLAIDGSKNILVDEKGGMASYNIIKQEITDIVTNLSAGTLFNVVFFERGNMKFFKPEPVPAGTEVVQELVQWIAPINEDYENLGLENTVKPALNRVVDTLVADELPRNQWYDGNEIGFLTQVFLQQSIDAAFIITGKHEGFKRIERDYTASEEADWQEYISSPDYQEQLRLFNEENPQAKARAEAKLRRINRDRAAEGLPPKVFTGNIVDAMDIERDHPHPGYRPRKYIELRTVEKYFRDVVDRLYSVRGANPPSINVILFLAEDEELDEEAEDGLQDYVRFFSGKYRILRGLSEIRSAANSSE